ncbi:hypothetical protein G5B46_22295 [Caulobacter sp. 602-2]|uniref:Alpha/beta hydrolase n=1 Tax=Caulobacter sp. 602-2 TaxID=2710887 RepID=A0A6G4R3I8_9CAUL|nr:hypothetical protein [Caulobacter sp. 602-2]NGM52351.1 hypothetical protein [Caulobacter sp. 602-2]
MRLSASACGVLVAASISGCTTVPDKPYHPVACGSKDCTPEELDLATGSRTVQVRGDGWLTQPCARSAYFPMTYDQAWLEVNEDGYLAVPAQLRAIERRIQRAHASGVPVLLAAYVHGWNGNADERPLKDCQAQSGQVNLFYAQMGRVTDTVQRLHDSKLIARKPLVIGVWVGWRGRDYRDPIGLSAPASFLSRGRTANAIGVQRGYDGEGRPSLHAALDELSKTLNDPAYPEDRMMLSGLSFGGRIITRLYRDRLEAGDTTPLGKNSLIVTFNAAVGSDCYEKALQANASKVPVTPPRWINVTSRADRARRIYYRIGTLLMKDGDFCDPSSRLRRVAIGFDDAQKTHELTFVSYAEDVDAPLINQGPVNWSSTEPAHAPIYYSRWDGVSYSLKSRMYDMRFQRKALNAGALWVVDTDHTAIASAGSHYSINDLHSNVFATNLTRLLITSLYDPGR